MNENTLEFSLRYNSSIDPMLPSDCLIEVMETMPILGGTMIRKTLFDIIINDCMYPDTSSVLTESAIFFRLKKNEGDVHIKINFSFQLRFQVIMKEQHNFDSKILHSIRLERSDNFMVLTSQKNLKELEVWREFFEKGFNQKGFHELFKAVKKIGKGSFATVYLVKKTEDEKYYAVKSFSKEVLYAEKKGKESLINQIEVMRKFNHKHLVKLYGVYETDHSIYIVIELVDGGLLSDRMLKKQKFSLLQIKMIMKSILEGLQAMHKKSIMHRDIKPENILIRNEKTCQCVIGDFGLSQYVYAEDYIFARCGTPGFVAPEIVNLRDKNAKYTQSCDLFSLGIIFHMLLLKKSPFSGLQYNEVLIQNRACSFNFNSFQYRQLPEESINLLQRLLQKDPKKRITASEALKHSFFYSQFTIWENNKKYCHNNNDNPHRRIEAPLTMIRSNERKKITHIRGDSCLKFKMTQNIVIEDSKDNEEKKDCAIKTQQMKSSLKKQRLSRKVD